MAVLRDEDDTEAFDIASAEAFHQTLGQLIRKLSLEPQISRTLNDRLTQANDDRIELVHRFFLAGPARIFDKTKNTTAELEALCDQFRSLSDGVLELATPALRRKGVSPESLREFGQVATQLLIEHPELGEGIDIWTDGEELIRRYGSDPA